MADTADKQVAVGEGASATTRPYDEQLREWARAILADQTPVKGGFAPAPLFPLPPAEEGGCDE